MEKETMIGFGVAIAVGSMFGSIISLSRTVRSLKKENELLENTLKLAKESKEEESEGTRYVIRRNSQIDEETYNEIVELEKENAELKEQRETNMQVIQGLEEIVHIKDDKIKELEITIKKYQQEKSPLAKKIDEVMDLEDKKGN